jgi:predicted DNA-binding transcriptional regulator YafY
MYSPTTRLLTVLEILQSRPSISGGELAERLEVDRRSVRRYLAMLQDLGIPIESTRGPAGGYRLRPGYKLPPMLFTDDEAVALTLGLRALPRLGVAVAPEAIEGALAKLERVLPEGPRLRVQALRHVPTLDDRTRSETASDVLELLTTAAEKSQTVRIRYESADGRRTEREVDPYGVLNRDVAWYLAGYCHLRTDLRTFRLSRITSVELTSESFQPPKSFDLAAFVTKSLASFPAEHDITLLIECSLEEAKRRVPPSHGEISLTDRGVLMRTRHDDLETVAHWIAGLGLPVQILEPDALRDVLRNWGASIIEFAQAAK